VPLIGPFKSIPLDFSWPMAVIRRLVLVSIDLPSLAQKNRFFVTRLLILLKQLRSQSQSRDSWSTSCPTVVGVGLLGRGCSYSDGEEWTPYGILELFRVEK
jgi:hypothetical protein